MAGVPRIEHRLIIRHPSRPAILVVEDGGGLRLPAVVSDDRHTAEVDYVNLAVRQRFGLSTTVLRSLGHSDPVGGVVIRTHELETHDDGTALASGLRWCGREELASRIGGEDTQPIGQWIETPSAAVDGREWTSPGWFDEVRAWLDRVLTTRVRAIVQLRAWEFSCVLRVSAEVGEFYFKAVPESIRHECAVTAYLARHFSGAVARVVATDPERRWLLMADAGGRKLEDIDEASAWERAAATYARLQLACVARRDDLRGLGCPTRSLDALGAAIEPLLADAAALRPGEPDGLSAGEIDRLRSRAAELRRRCERLADCEIPLTLEHGDLWPGNFLVDGTSCTLIDWEDVAIGHPFVSLGPLIVGLGMYQPRLASRELTERLERAYVTALAPLAPAARLTQALRLAAPLGFVDMAVRYRQQRPSVARLHPWMRDLVPHTLRLALAQLDAGED
jgi:Phosphotransferase enzyme family